MSNLLDHINNELDLADFLNISPAFKGVLNNNIDLSREFAFRPITKKMLFSSSKVILKKPDSEPLSFEVDKDMSNHHYTDEFNPADYPEYFPNMAPFTEDNIVVGDKNEEDRFIASYWSDLGDDVFDGWGYFYLYDVLSGKYYFPIFSPQNQYDGTITTQVFNAFGRTFTIKHGWATYSVFKFDISVNDNYLFKFGAYGNMGSDGHEINTHLTYSYTLNSHNKTLHYLKLEEEDNANEVLYSYFIPKNQSENNSVAYNLYQQSGEDDNSLMSKELTQGVLVYFAKTLDAKIWVTNDVKNIIQ